MITMKNEYMRIEITHYPYYEQASWSVLHSYHVY